MMTEAEAKEKWCPFARLTNSDAYTQVSWNRIIPSEEKGILIATGNACMGSGCMAWRWTYRKLPISPEITGVVAVAHAVANRKYEVTNEGFCGLAGKP